MTKLESLSLDKFKDDQIPPESYGTILGGAWKKVGTCKGSYDYSDDQINEDSRLDSGALPSSDWKDDTTIVDSGHTNS